MPRASDAPPPLASAAQLLGGVVDSPAGGDDRAEASTGVGEPAGPAGVSRPTSPQQEPDLDAQQLAEHGGATRRSMVANLAGVPASLLDEAEAEHALARALASPSANRCVLCRWFLVTVGCLLAGAVLWYGCDQLFFASARMGTCNAAGAAATQTRVWIEWFIGWAPGYLRVAILLWFAKKLCERVSGYESQGLGLALLAGRGAGDGAADRAGWVAIVEATNERPQPTWTEAKEARDLSGEQALSSATAKFVLWHLSQPTAFLLLLFAYHCFVAELGPKQQFLAGVVAAREIVYLCNLMFAAVKLPVFLLLDLRTVWEESTPLQRFVRLAMYTLTPHNYLALCCAARFPAWRRVFLGLAGIQVIADISSCYALAALLASTVEHTAATEHVGPLKVGYAITAFGFLLFFGPLSIATNIEAAINVEHRIIRTARGIMGGLLLLAWAYLMTLIVLLMFNKDVFCPGKYWYNGLTLQDPCNGHGTCYAAAQCNCSLGYGPKSKASGDPLCSCPVGWTGEHCDRCENGYIGEHCSAAFVLSGANGTVNHGSNALYGDWDGVYVRIAQVCHAKPVYRKSFSSKSGSLDMYISPSGPGASHPLGWSVNAPTANAVQCDDGATLLLSQYYGVCSESPDGDGCVGLWEDMSGMHPTAMPAIKVVAAGGLGCIVGTPLSCSNHGVCVGRTADQPYESRSCACDSGWSGEDCEEGPCAVRPCGVHGVCYPDPDSVNAEGHTCTCDPGYMLDGTSTTCIVDMCYDIAHHKPNTCSLHGICDPTDGSCRCESGFSGPHCTMMGAFHGSRIIQDHEGVSINYWANKADQKWSLCYSSFGCMNAECSPAAFHSQCDSFGITVTVARNSMNSSFGGYAEVSWGSSGAIWHTGDTSTDFIFGLRPQLTSYGMTGKNPHFQSVHPDWWPTWGFEMNPDLGMGHGGPPGVGAGCTQGSTYTGSPGQICGGDGDWGETELEVWRLIDEEPPFPNSRIITDRSWSETINGWMGTPGEQWELCYSSFTDDKSSPAVFHSQCDRYSVTIAVARNANNYTFGGLAVGSWSTSDCCQTLQNICGSNFCRDLTSRSDFIFGLWPGTPARFDAIHESSTYQLVASEEWPHWGSEDWFDLFIGSRGPPGDNGRCDQGHDYAGVADQICGGGSWGETHVEVWRRATDAGQLAATRTRSHVPN